MSNMSNLFTSGSLGINAPWLYGKGVNFIGSEYDKQAVRSQLKYISDMGFKIIRTWITVDSVFEYSGGYNGDFSIRYDYVDNALDFLDVAYTFGLSVIVVMADGNSQSQPASLDGKVQWTLFKSDSGIEKYRKAMLELVNSLKSCESVYAWEVMNEPYGSGTNHGFSAWANEVGVTADDVHKWLKVMYNAVKGEDNQRIVCFSDYEEEQQEKYRIYINDEFRRKYIDDCTDVYSLHIYRPDSSYLADYRSITGKEKWIGEVGGINYTSGITVEHPIPGHGELYSPRNKSSVISICNYLKNQGFSLFMPWSMADNNFIVDFSIRGGVNGNLGEYLESVLRKREYRQYNYPFIEDDTRTLSIWSEYRKKRSAIWD